MSELRVVGRSLVGDVGQDEKVEVKTNIQMSRHVTGLIPRTCYISCLLIGKVPTCMLCCNS
jgi:hypothetical protein